MNNDISPNGLKVNLQINSIYNRRIHSYIEELNTFSERLEQIQFNSSDVNHIRFNDYIKKLKSTLTSIVHNTPNPLEFEKKISMFESSLHNIRSEFYSYLSHTLYSLKTT